MPDVPTVAEAGGPAGFEVNSFVSLVAPKGMSSELKNKINADVLKVLADPEVKAGFNTFASTPQWIAFFLLLNILCVSTLLHVPQLGDHDGKH